MGKLKPHIANAATWLGANWYKIMSGWGWQYKYVFIILMGSTSVVASIWDSNILETA